MKTTAEAGYEYRLLIERPNLHGPSVFETGLGLEVAEVVLGKERARYEKWEPRTRVWMERREVAEWQPFEPSLEAPNL